ncbi:MAG: hypothetical protein JNK15_02800 [Planctomycetes bacterium]|nr:hypothetical protein [Planctomycetota bacterium]
MEPSPPSPRAATATPAPSAMALRVPLAKPPRGGCSRVQLGSSELLLESVRGGHSLLWTNGRTARRTALGLPADGKLVLELRAPQFPLVLTLRDGMVLGPRSRLCGYVWAPLVPTLVWNDSAAASQVLLEVTPEGLAAEWDEVFGHVQTCATPWLARFPMRNGEPRAVVPLRLHNDTRTVASVGSLPMVLRDQELAMLRGCIVTRPRRLHWRGERFGVAADGPGQAGVA